MDLAIQTETNQVPDLSWLGTTKGMPGPFSATIATGELIEATHFPDGFVKSGTLVGLFTAGGNSGLWGPWVQDGANGEEVIGGVVYTGFQVRKAPDGTLVSARTVGSILLPNTGVVVNTAKLPALLLTDDTTANSATAAELSAAGFIPKDLGV